MLSLPAGYPSDPNAAFALLKSRRRLSLDDLKVLAILECFGEAFYLDIARNIGNDEARALLTRNGHEERGHAHRLLKAMTLLGGAAFELPAPADNPFLQAATPAIAVNADFLGLLEKGEADGDLQYQAWAAAEPHPEVAQLYRQNGAEETRHGQRVTQVKRLLQGR
jgi:hypothetical protein